MAFGQSDLQAMSELAMKAKDLQERLKNELKGLADKEYNSIYEAGNIKVKMYGDYRVVSVLIAPDFLATRTAEEISEGVAQAFNNCRATIEEEKADVAKRYEEESNQMMRAVITAHPSPDASGDSGDGNG